MRRVGPKIALTHTQAQGKRKPARSVGCNTTNALLSVAMGVLILCILAGWATFDNEGSATKRLRMWSGMGANTTAVDTAGVAGVVVPVQMPVKIAPPTVDAGTARPFKRDTSQKAEPSPLPQPSPLPAVDSTISTCAAVPAHPDDGLTGAVGTEYTMTLSIADGTYSVRVPELHECEHAYVEITPIAGGLVLSPSTAASIDLDALPFAFSLITYTSTGAVEPCAVNAADKSTCKQMRRRLPVTLNAARTAYIVKVFPDPAVGHYIIQGQDARAADGGCAVTPILTVTPFKAAYETCDLKYAGHKRPHLLGYGPMKCLPLLHLDVPMPHDFYVALLGPDSGLTEQSQLDVTVASTNAGPDAADYKQASLLNGRIGFGTGLVASYGVNKFLVKAPKIVQEDYPAHVANSTLYGRLAANDILVNVIMELHFNAELQGYVGTFDLRDPGLFTLQVAVGWYFGNSEPKDLPMPILVGGHMGHGYGICNFRRALVDGGPIQVTVTEQPPPELQRFGTKKCPNADSPGRWFFMFDKPCAPPYCTGDREATINAMDWDGSTDREWVWVPYDCYYHLYSQTDAYTCAGKTGVDWILTMGDSQEREFVAQLKMMNGSVSSTTKFEQADFIMHGSPNNLRTTWQFYTPTFMWRDAFSNPREFAVDQLFFDHFNIRPSATSGAPLHDYNGHALELDQQEESRPSVFVLNNAAAYTGWYQRWDNHVKWTDDLLAYLDNGKMLDSAPAVAGRPGISRPMKLIWFTPPFIFSQAHAGTDYVTTYRQQTYDRYIRQKMRDIGVSVADGTAITQSQWEVSYDGLHYLRGGQDVWHGQISGMVFHAIMNLIFPTCDTEQPLPSAVAPRDAVIPTAIVPPSASPAPVLLNWTSCDPPGFPGDSRPSDDLQSITFKTARGTTYTLSLSQPLYECESMDLLVSVDPPIPAGTIIDTESLDVRVIAFAYTSIGSPGQPCNLTAHNVSDCLRLDRVLPLRQDLNRPSQLYARFVPDAASQQYKFVVEDMTMAEPRTCSATPLLALKPYRNTGNDIPLAGHAKPGLIGYGADICKPVLHFNAPAAHDFYISLLPNGGITDAAAAPGATSAEFSKALLFDKRVGVNTGLVASPGVNKFVVKWPSVIAQYYPDHIRHITFYGRLVGPDTIVNLDMAFVYDEQLKGYVGTFDLRDPGTFTLQVALSYFYGDSSPLDPKKPPKPVLVGGHMTHSFKNTNFLRALIDGAPTQLVLKDIPASLQRFGSAKCASGDMPGRWINLHGKECQVPYCTGDRKNSVHSQDWDNSRDRSWMWVPYSCYYHMFTRDDTYSCAKATGMDWVLTMGDSQEREFVAQMKMMNGTVIDATKFEQADFIMYQSPNNLRVTWQFFTESYMWRDTFLRPREFGVDQKMFDHFNIRPTEKSGEPLGFQPENSHDFYLHDKEETRPSVFVLNNAAAYTAWYAEWDNHVKWVADLLAYIDNGKMLDSAPSVPGRPGITRPMKLIWFSPPFIFSAAHAGTDYVTTHRQQTYDRYVQGEMRRIGVPVVDGSAITKSMWEAAYDGLHYLRGGNDNWYGSVSAMVFQTILNVIFPDCDSNGAKTVPMAAVTSPNTAATTPAAAATTPAGSCVPPDVPPQPTTSSPSPLQLQVGDSEWSLQFGHVGMCDPLELTLTSTKPVNGLEVDPNSLPVQLFVHFYTKSDLKGEACGAEGVGCAKLSRRLPLRFDVERKVFVGQLTPDPASIYYVFELRATAGGCVASKTVQVPPFTEVYRQCLAPFAGHSEPNVQGSQTKECKPLLHLSMPAATDFYISLLPDGGISPAASVAGAANAPWTQPAVFDNRVTAHTGIVASYGVNRFVVKHPAFVGETYPKHVAHATFYGRLINTENIVNLNMEFTYDAKLSGYVGTFDLRDAGSYTLQVVLGWYFGDSVPKEEPMPILVGGHMGHHYSECNFRRALVDAAPVQITLPQAGVKDTPARFGHQKCPHADHPGRWINMGDKPCEAPYCSGDRKTTINFMDWDGNQHRQWVWVPYDCYYHLYSRTDTYTCAKDTGIDWILTMGDSQEREFVAHLKMMNGSQTSTTKFEQADFIMDGSPNNLRATWQFYTSSYMWLDAFQSQRDFNVDKFYFDHFNIRPAETSGLPLDNFHGHDYDLNQKEDSRPSIFLMSNAAAYTGWYSKWETHVKWVDDLLAYIDNGKMLDSAPAVAGRPGISRPMKLIWFTPPFIFSQAHAGTDYVTTYRQQIYDRYVQQKLRAIGVPIADGTAITQSQWESAYDGLHYFLGGNDNWYGSVSTMVFHAILNEIFPTCTTGGAA